MQVSHVGNFFARRLLQKLQKLFTLLAVFRSRSFEHVVFAYVVFTQAKLCAMQVSQVGKFFARRFVAKSAKTFVFYPLFFAVEVLIMWC